MISYTRLSPLFLLLIVIWSVSPRSPMVETITAAAPSEQPHVIFIVVDTVRPDHVSAYGYERNTTPNFDGRIADQGVLFTAASTTSPWTCPANAAMLTGRFPTTLGSTWATIGNSIPAAEHTLAEQLQEAGYYTAGFTSGPYCVKGDLGFNQGFDLYDDSFTSHPSPSKARAEELNDLFFDWLDTSWTLVISGTQPLFLFLYYFDPHTWYDPPPPYDALYDPDYDDPMTAALFGHGQTAKSGDLEITERDLTYLEALYDGEIAYWDYHLGQLLDRLETLNLLDNALILITSDHGEMFGEHDEWSHAGSLYEEVTRVPLVMRYSGVITAGATIDAPVYNMDLMPTILDYVGLPIGPQVEAMSLRPFIEGHEPLTDRLIFAEVDKITDPNHGLYWAAPRFDLRTGRLGPWKRIHHVGHPSQDGLYFLNDHSQYEVENLINEEEETAVQTLRLIMDHFFGSSPNSVLTGKAQFS
jgi:arylsulfatase A-like enzyme